MPARRQNVSARAILLDLLRVSRQPLPVAELLASAGLFGIASGTLRVALSRCLKAGTVVRSEPSQYRLADRAAVLANFVERWRRSESLQRPWRNEWLVAILPPSRPASERADSLYGLRLTGFRQVLRGQYLRPDNLDEDLRTLLRSMGLPEEATWHWARGFAAEKVIEWVREQWQSEERRSEQQALSIELEQSSKELQRGAPLEESLPAAYDVARRSVRQLALDPLLPVELEQGGQRRQLAAAVRRHEELAHRGWAEYLQTLR